MIMTRNFVCRVLRVWDRLALPSRADGGGAGPYVRHGCLRNDLSANTWPLQRDRQAGVKTAFIGASFLVKNDHLQRQARDTHAKDD